jgi:hypothetical protein
MPDLLRAVGALVSGLAGLAWPIVAIVVVVLLRPTLKQLLIDQRLKSLSVGPKGVALELSEQRANVEAAISILETKSSNPEVRQLLEGVRKTAETLDALAQFRIIASAMPSSVVEADCPTTIKFSALVTYEGTGGTFEYVWLRSDGAIQTERSRITFSGPGTQVVRTTWTLGAATSTFHGWAQLQILTTPNVVSNRAAFTLVCR